MADPIDAIQTARDNAIADPVTIDEMIKAADFEAHRCACSQRAVQALGFPQDAHEIRRVVVLEKIMGLLVLINENKEAIRPILYPPKRKKHGHSG